jgi:hypothetical protein
MRWVSCRDLSIAAALFALYYQNKPSEMGTIILSGMILCVTDCVLVYRYRQDYFPFLLGAGASTWAWIGWELLKL